MALRDKLVPKEEKKTLADRAASSIGTAKSITGTSRIEEIAKKAGGRPEDRSSKLGSFQRIVEPSIIKSTGGLGSKLVSKEESEAMKGFSVELLPDDAGLKVFGDNIPEQSILKKDFTPEQKEVFFDLRTARYIQEKYDEAMKEYETAMKEYERTQRSQKKFFSSLTRSFSAKEMIGIAEKDIEAKRQLQDKIVDQLHEARREGDEGKEEALVRALQATMDDEVLARAEDEVKSVFSPADIKDPKVWMNKETIPVFGSAEILGRGWAKGVGVKQLTKVAAEDQERKIATQNKLLEEINAARRDGDKDREKNLLNILKITTEDNLSVIIQEELDSAPDTAQVLSAAGELALTAALAYKSYYPSGASFKKVKIAPPIVQKAAAKKLTADVIRETLSQPVTKEFWIETAKATKTKLIAQAKRYGKAMGKSAVIGGGFSGLTAGKIPDRTPEQVVEETIKGAKVGALVAGGILAVADAAKFAYSVTSPFAQEYVEKAEANLRKIVDGKVEPSNILERSLEGIKTEPTFKQKVAKVGLDILESRHTLRQKTLDRFHPIRRVEDDIYEIKGAPLSEQEKVYRDVRILNDYADGISAEKTEELKGFLLQYTPEEREYAKGYMNILSNLDRASAGMDVPTGKTVKQLESELIDMLIHTRNEGLYDSINEIKSFVRDYTTRELLEMKAAGLIDDAQIANMLRVHPNYIPHDVIVDEIERRFIGVGSENFNLTNKGVHEAIGSLKKIKDPYEALVGRTVMLEKVKQKNLLLGNLIDAHKEYGVIPDAKAVQTAENVKRRREIFSEMSILKEELKVTKSQLSISKRADTKILNRIQKIEDEIKLTEKLIGTDADYVSKVATLKDKAASQIDILKNIDKASTEDAVKFFSDLEKQIGAQRSELWEEAQRLAAIKVGRGEETISFFVDGIKEEWIVPKNLASAIKGTDIIPTPAFWKGLMYPNKVLKGGATTYNIEFTATNKLRDSQTSASLNGAIIEDLTQRYGFDPDIARQYSSKELDAIYSKGGFGASIFDKGDRAVTSILKDAGIIKKSTMDLAKEWNPLRAVKELNDFVEMSTRKAGVAEALLAGLSPKDAVFASRDMTIDFAVMGEWMRIPNQAIPFLNANIQGMAAIPKAMLNSPERFSEVMMTTSVLPTMLLHQHNRRFESFKYVNPALKERYWIVMTNEIPAINPYTGEDIVVPQMMTFKKGEAQTLVSSPLQHWLETQDGLDSRGVSEMLVDMFGSISPVDFGLFSRQNFALSLASSLGFYGHLYVGASAGKDPFYGTEIVPRSKQDLHREMQYTDRTPEIYKRIPKSVYRSGFAEFANLSPAMMEYYSTVFGSMPEAIIKGIDMIYNVKRGKQVSVTDTPHETLTEIPVIRRFMRQRITAATDEEKKLIREIEKDVKTERAVFTERAKEIVMNLRILKTATERRNYLNMLGDELTPEMMEAIAERAKVVESVQGLSSVQDVDTRVEVITYYIERMKQRGASNTEIAEYLQELIDKNVLTEEAARRLNDKLQYIL